MKEVGIEEIEREFDLPEGEVAAMEEDSALFRWDLARGMFIERGL